MAALRSRASTLAVAESCTGGLIGDLVTDVPGASDVFLGGVVAYTNSLKVEALGVPESLLAAEGAVSEGVVIAMADGARHRLQSTYGLAASGIAGPTGGTPDKPVGTVWVGLAGPSGGCAKILRLPFERRNNKIASAAHALDLLRQELARS